MTRLQRDLLRFIERYIVENDGVAPSFSEMAIGAGLSSKGYVHRIVEALEAQGFIRRHKGKARTIEVISHENALSAFTDDEVCDECRRRGLRVQA